MKAFILAGGLGTRIRSLFPDVPKSMIPVNGKPFLEWQIRALVAQDIKEIILCVSYQAEAIIDYFGNGQRLGAQVDYSSEPKPMGTAGALRLAHRDLTDTTLVLNGDTYLPVDYAPLIQAHRHFVFEKSAIASICLANVPNAARYGQVNLDSNGQITSFAEKSSAAQPGLVNAGVYVVEPDILDSIAPNKAISIEREVFPALLKQNKLYGVCVQRSFIDMGTPEGYDQLSNELRG